MEKKLTNPLHWLNKKSADFLVALIKTYQKTFSPDHGPAQSHDFSGCKFYPSCSTYSIQALKKYGLLKGLAKTMWRILRCHPWSAGGVDKP